MGGKKTQEPVPAPDGLAGLLNNIFKLWSKQPNPPTNPLTFTGHQESIPTDHQPHDSLDIDRSVEPPPVFDYQFAKSPAPSIASSYRSRQQQQRGIDRPDNLQAIAELDESDYEDEQYPPSQFGRPDSRDSTFGPRPISRGADGYQWQDLDALGAVRPPIRSDFGWFRLEDTQTSEGTLGNPFPGPFKDMPSKVNGFDLRRADEASTIEETTSFAASPEVTSSALPPLSNIQAPSSDPKTLGPDPPSLNSRSSTSSTSKTTTAPAQTRPAYYNTTKPTCSLNLVCYRSGANGCDLQQIHCVLRSSFPDEAKFHAAVKANPQLIHADDQFFREIQRLYKTQMCGFFRRYFSLKSLKAFRILAYTPTTRPVVVPLDDFILQEMMYAYRHPNRLGRLSSASSHSTDDWIRWVFRLRRRDRRHALEFVEGWNTTRIAVSGTAPWLSSCLLGVVWTVMSGGDAQTAFTVASFLLTSSSVILALLAIISSIESSG
ncbi:hypothetical protein QBC39DRAFT_350311 [Podospora conica]|nr:hypothetical protein QBC39DRAFT_350311 [Schizothecium conicum]